MLKFMKKVPGGLLLVPMVISALINTFFPGLFEIGGLTESLFTGKSSNTLLALICFIASTGLRVRDLGKLFKKQGVLLLFKAFLSFLIGFAYLQIFGASGILGISALAIIIAMTSINPTLYLTLVEDYGTHVDEAAFGLISLFSVPALPMFVYGASQSISIDWIDIVSIIIPTAIGILVGNLDNEMYEFTKPGIGIATIFLGWASGSIIDFKLAFRSLPQGLILGVFLYFIFMPISIALEKYILKYNGIVSVAITSVAGVSIPFAKIIAEVIPEAKQYVSSATSQIVLLVIITSVLTPYFTGRRAKKLGIEQKDLKLHI